MRTRSHVNGTQRKRMIHTSNFHSIPFISPKKTRGKRQIELSPETSSSPRETPCITNRREREWGTKKRGNKRPRECAHFWATSVSVWSSRNSSFQALPATSFLRLLPSLRFLPTHVSSFGALRLSRSGGERACRTNLSVPTAQLQQSSDYLNPECFRRGQPVLTCNQSWFPVGD
jgi:hypothetical protein